MGSGESKLRTSPPAELPVAILPVFASSAEAVFLSIPKRGTGFFGGKPSFVTDTATKQPIFQIERSRHMFEKDTESIFDAAGKLLFLVSSVGGRGVKGTKPAARPDAPKENMFTVLKFSRKVLSVKFRNASTRNEEVTLYLEHHRSFHDATLTDSASRRLCEMHSRRGVIEVTIQPFVDASLVVGIAMAVIRFEAAARRSRGNNAGSASGGGGGGGGGGC